MSWYSAVMHRAYRILALLVLIAYSQAACTCQAGQNQCTASACRKKMLDDYNVTFGGPCAPCPIGRFDTGKEGCTAGPLSCRPYRCEAGRYSAKPSYLATNATLYNATLGHKSRDEACPECAAGKYTESEEDALLGRCKDCPEGKWTDTSRSDRCPPGYPPGICPCARGQYVKQSTDATFLGCAPCPLGRWGGPEGSCPTGPPSKPGPQPRRPEQCPFLSCPKGKYRAALPGNNMGHNTTDAACPICAAGRFTAGRDQPSCTDCPYGKWTDVSGSDHCPYGFRPTPSPTPSPTPACNNTGSNCCPGSKMQPARRRRGIAPHAVPCVQCGIGEYTNSRTATSCTGVGCARGDYWAEVPKGGHTSSASVCQKCPDGKYSNGDSTADRRVCTRCVNGKISVLNGFGRFTSCACPNSGCPPPTPWPTQSPTSAPTPAPTPTPPPTPTLYQLSNLKCEFVTFAAYDSIEEARKQCQRRGIHYGRYRESAYDFRCGGVHDAGCDGAGPFRLCRSATGLFREATGDCIYRDEAPTPPPTRRPTLAPTPPPTPRPTRAPTPIPGRGRTRAPTPQATFRPQQPKVVFRTALVGFTVATFTRGIRRAFRVAFARRHKVDVERVIITNVRAARRARTRSRRRQLQGSGIAFDCEVSADTVEAAKELNTEIKGGVAAEDTAVLEEFRRQIEVVQSMEDYDDDTLQTVAPAALAITTSAGGVELEAAAPIPAPSTGNGIGTGGVVGAVFGAIACAGALAFAVQWRRHRLASAPKTLQSTGGTGTAKDPTLHMHEVFPNALAPPVARQVGTGESSVDHDGRAGGDQHGADATPRVAL